MKIDMGKKFLVDSEETVYGNDRSKVMCIYDFEGTLIHAGNLLMKDFLQYRKNGYTIKEMPIEEYRKSQIKIYEKS